MCQPTLRALGFALLGLAAMQLQAAEFPIDDLVDEGKLVPQGTTYSVLAPDTLDLAHHATLAINCLTTNVEPTRAWSVYQVMSYGQEPKLDPKALTWNLPAKNVRALPYLRVMTGSTQGTDVEAEIMRILLANVHEDGCAYFPVENDGAPKDSSYPYVNGLIAQAAWVWQQRDNNPEWTRVMQTLSEGMARIAIKVEDRAYYPPECGYKKGGEWLWTMRGEAKIPYTPPAEPDLEQQGLEGCVKYEQSGSLRGMALYLENNKNDEVHNVVNAITRFMLKPGMWEDTTIYGQPGNQTGVWAGHFHGNATSLMALLDVAQLNQDEWLKQFVRRAYDHGMRTGIQTVGWVPGWLRPLDHYRDAALFLRGETCGVADMLELAVKLTDAGIGDYWDDVESMARNHLIAQQATDLNQIARFSGNPDDPTLKRIIGSFGQGHPTYNDPVTYGCCSGNGAIALYYAWDGITRFDGETAHINMFINRAAPWLDVDSYIPHEGKVVIHNKQARQLKIRVPYWVDRTKMVVRVNNNTLEPAWAGNYLVLAGLTPAAAAQQKGDQITLEFPIEKRTEHYDLQGVRHKFNFRGPTVISAEPRTTNTNQVQYYERQALDTDVTPMRETTRFVANQMLPLF